MRMTESIARREFLKRAGLVTAGAAFFPGRFLQKLAAGEAQAPEPAPVDAKETLDALLDTYRKHTLSGLRAGGSGGGNHIPMVLIALYRMGGSAEQMRRYVRLFNLQPEAAKPIDASWKDKITLENWQRHLGRGDFHGFIDFFERWVQATSLETVLKESVPFLIRRSNAGAYHPLLRLGYAIDYGDREEIVHSLAGWAGGSPSPDFDIQAPPVAPDALLSEITQKMSDFRLGPSGGIEDSAKQVYAQKAFYESLKPVRVPDTNPMERISEIIMEAFTQTKDFTLLHAVTSCQAVRLMVPYLRFPQESLSWYWHSVCANYLVVSKEHPRFGKDSVTGGSPGWKELLLQAAASDVSNVSVYEHRVKLVYSCWLDSQHYKRDRYLALAARGWSS